MNKISKKWLISLSFVICHLSWMPLSAHEVYNFNSDWVIDYSELTSGKKTGTERVTLPHAWNEDEAFKIYISDQSDGIVWYRKTFTLPESAKGQRVILEFEGCRMAADVLVNGKEAGYSENGVMAFGFDITDLLQDGENLVEVKTDNSWTYLKRQTNSELQWNSTNFFANYGGLNKNVWLHVLPKVHQTLPLYSNLGTTGVYIYAKDFDIAARKATICVESEVQNDLNDAQGHALKVIVSEFDGREVARFESTATSLAPNGARTILKAERQVDGLHFWSWGYGYLYKVTTIVANDTVTTTTGFRKTEFKNGMFYLNDRVMQVHGYAQRTTNEWPGVGQCVPAWVSDYSNDLVVKSGGNLVRWMHVTPWIQDVKSCDRVGLIQAMPAGDAESDVTGQQWIDRTELMRDAIIYLRNYPSIIFYECGNADISVEHMKEMLVIRDQYDPYGGRAMGSRGMRDVAEAEYGGEMLYINKSKTKPVWMMEYCRDEGVRGYWNSWSEPFHKEGNDQVYYNYLPNNDEQQFDRMGSSTVSVQRGTAYLHIPMEGLASETLQMVFDDDGELTDIIKVFGLQVDRGDNGYYTLDGKRVSPTGNGLYIHNGKKVVVNSTTTVK
jgi:beta-galactosidase/beta-glucuronidase